MLAILSLVGGVRFAVERRAEDPDRARALAESELRRTLARGEKVAVRLAVFRRYWWDYFRPTYGVLAATDRRLIYVGVTPPPLLRRPSGPKILESGEMSYSVRLVAKETPLRGPGSGIRFTAPGAREEFRIDVRDRGKVAALRDVIQKAVQRQQDSTAAERRATEVAEAAARRAIYHLVQRGEALTTIASRYGTVVESLQVWNSMSSPRIVVGQRLLVRPALP